MAAGHVQSKPSGDHLALGPATSRPNQGRRRQKRKETSEALHASRDDSRSRGHAVQRDDQEVQRSEPLQIQHPRLIPVCSAAQKRAPVPRRYRYNVVILRAPSRSSTIVQTTASRANHAQVAAGDTALRRAQDDNGLVRRHPFTNPSCITSRSCHSKLTQPCPELDIGRIHDPVVDPQHEVIAAAGAR